MAESNPNLIPINRRVTKRVTVPEKYRKAAKILKLADERKDSVKNLIYSSGHRVSYTFQCLNRTGLHFLSNCLAVNLI